MPSDRRDTTLLIISFSDLQRDARLRRQVAAFVDRYRVITAGYGADPLPGVVRHITLPLPPTGGARRRRMLLEGALFRLRAYALTHLTDPAARAARRALRDVSADVVLANDVDAAPVAFAVAEPSRIHLDLHEFFPGLHDDNPRWARLRGRYNEWLVRRFAARAASTTTVAAEIAGRYAEYGLSPSVVTNAPDYRDVLVTPPHKPLRIVHSGAALAGRHLEAMMEGVAMSRSDAVLTMHLMPNDPAYLSRLHVLAERLGPRIRIADPVAQPQLIETLAQHDVGIHFLPATSTNHTLALPNKFFDFVQARLGVIVGPTPAMAGLTRRHGFGAVADGFQPEDVAAVVDGLSTERVAAWKHAADAAARVLSAEQQVPVWNEAIARIVSSVAEGPPAQSA